MCTVDFSALFFYHTGKGARTFMLKVLKIKNVLKFKNFCRLSRRVQKCIADQMSWIHWNSATIFVIMKEII